MTKSSIKLLTEKNNYWLIIPAAGIGKRMGNSFPKQYLKVNNKTILEHSFTVFSKLEFLQKIILVLNSEDIYWPRLAVHYPFIELVHGGADRAHSVLNGLHALEGRANQDDWVLVHDAVRPCLSPNDLTNLLTGLSTHPIGGLLATPLHQTLKRVDHNHRVIATLDRQHLWQAQTPQMFRYPILLTALTRALADRVDITDEASAIEYLGYQPLVIEGGPENVKLTSPADLELIRRYLPIVSQAE